MVVKKLHEETMASLITLKKLEAQRADLRDQQRAVMEACKHHDWKPQLVETMAFDMTPRRICIVCQEHVPGINDEEKKALWMEYYADLDMELPKEWEHHKDGSNFR